LLRRDEVVRFAAPASLGYGFHLQVPPNVWANAHSGSADPVIPVIPLDLTGIIAFDAIREQARCIPVG
jgi:hypothetical protein